MGVSSVRAQQFPNVRLQPMITRRSKRFWTIILITALTGLSWLGYTLAYSSSPTDKSNNVAPTHSFTSENPSTSIKQETELNTPMNTQTNSSSSISFSSTDSSVNVNGQDIEVPKNGSVNKTVIQQDGNGYTKVKVKSHNSTSANGSSSTNLNVSTESTSISSHDEGVGD